MKIQLYNSDEVLINAFRSGDRTAFTTLYNRFYSSLYHFGRRFISHEDARDAVADAFVNLWSQRGNFDAIPKIERWLFNTIRFQCLALLRRQVRLHDAQDEIRHQLENAQASVLLSEDLTTQLVALLYSEIDRLPARQREVFLLSFEEGLKPSQIAERLSLSVKTVKNHKASAIRLLQSVLGQRAVILALLVLLYEDGTLGQCPNRCDGIIINKNPVSSSHTGERIYRASECKYCHFP